MTLLIRPVAEADVPAVIELSLLAWEPVFASFQQLLGLTIYRAIYPDWRAQQSQAITAICRPDSQMTVWVAHVDGTVAGFIAYSMDAESQTGEIEYLAVHPAYHKRGIGTKLNAFALDRLKEGGMKLAVVGTGGDPSHAAARRSYEKAGYTALPLVRYYKDLGDPSPQENTDSLPQ